MCYKFSTEDVVPPKLQANAQTSNDVQYSVASGTDGSITVDTYWGLYLSNTGGAHPAVLDEKIKTDTGTEMTILNAMKNDTFDRCASPEKKQEVWNVLTGGGASYASSQSGQKLNIVAGTTYVPVNNFINFDDLLLNNTYIFVVAAVNQQGGTPVFRSLQGIQRIDTSGPKIDSITTTGNIATDSRFYGTVTIRFDKELYMKYRDPAKGDQVPYKSQKTDAQSISGSCEVKPSDSQTIAILVSNMQLNSVITIIPRRDEGEMENWFVSKDGYAREAILALRLVETTDEAGKTTYQFVIDGGAYDGMTSETADS